MADDVVIGIERDADLVTARAEARALAMALGFSPTDATLIATAVSEIARNIVVHVGRGEISLGAVHNDRRAGLVVVARDAGAGIADVEAALQGASTWRGGTGLGLPGARRLMDEFEIESAIGRGTTVTMRKWHVTDELERLRARRAAR